MSKRNEDGGYTCSRCGKDVPGVIGDDCPPCHEIRFAETVLRKAGLYPKRQGQPMTDAEEEIISDARSMIDDPLNHPPGRLADALEGLIAIIKRLASKVEKQMRIEKP